VIAACGSGSGMRAGIIDPRGEFGDYRCIDLDVTDLPSRPAH